jgi:hypothetical protein
MTQREQILTALAIALGGGTAIERNAAVPGVIPAAGQMILHDGVPGTPEVTLSPLRFHFEHRAELDIAIDGAADMNATYDALIETIAARLAVDRTLGGLCDYLEAEAPAPSEIVVEGAAPLRAATIGIIITYSTPSSLG